MAEPPPTQPVAPPAPAPVPPPPTNPVGAVASAATNRASINPAFRYLGIPPSVLAWRPRVPSRNVSIFLTVTVSLTSLYVYDRRECKRLKQEYLGKVRHLARERVGGATEGVPDWMPRKVTVYGARVPEDVDVDRGAQWFKKYVKVRPSPPSPLSLYLRLTPRSRTAADVDRRSDRLQDRQRRPARWTGEKGRRGDPRPPDRRGGPGKGPLRRTGHRTRRDGLPRMWGTSHFGST